VKAFYLSPVTGVKAAFEAHIEQGPILEKQQKQIGIVTGIQGLRWYELTIEGTPCHAGPTPMEDREDPVRALLIILQACYDQAAEHSPWGRATIGDIQTFPGSPNTVPEKVFARIDVRHPEADVVSTMAATLESTVENVAKVLGTPASLKEVWRMEVTEFADNCIDAVQQAVDELGYSHMRMFSGAGHDSLYTAQKVPTSMIFVPCEKGLSHNEAENAAQEDLAAGTNVLLRAILDQANSNG